MTENGGKDYKHSISLPETAFPMRGDLPKREPGMLAGWLKQGLYAKVRAKAKAENRPLFVWLAGGRDRDGTPLERC